MKIFILEDEIDIYPRIQLREILEKKHELTLARSCDDAIAKYPGGEPYDLLLLDHDMEGDYEYRPDYPNTGYQFVKWLCDRLLVECYCNEDQGAGYTYSDEHGDCDFCLRAKPQVILHSHNTVGKERMKLLLEEHGFSVDVTRFGTEYVKQVKEQLG